MFPHVQYDFLLVSIPHAILGCQLGMCTLLPGHFSFLFLLCAVGSGRTGEPGEGVVDVMVGRLICGNAPQSPVPLRWHGCLASSGITSWRL